MKLNIPVNVEDSDMDDGYPDFNDDELEIIDETELDIFSDGEQQIEEFNEFADQHEVLIEKEIIDESFMTFAAHKEPVITCALNSNATLGASGSQDETGFVFNMNNCEILFELEGHHDTVMGVGFNINDKFVASCDMQGFIQVWEIDCKRKIFDYELDEDLNWFSWHPLIEDVLILGTSSGNSWLLKVTDNTQCKVLPGFGFPSSAGTIFNDGRRAAIGYENGSIRIWDLKNASLLHNVQEPFGHQGTVTCIDIKKDDLCIATGSIDGTSKLFQSNTGKILASFECGRVEKISSGAGTSSSGPNEDAVVEADSVESVAFCELLNLLATATLNGHVEIWDLSSRTRRNFFTSEGGVSKIMWDKINPHILYASGLDGIMKMWDARSGKMESTKTGHSNQILDFTLAKNSSLILTASEDKSCKIFRLQ